MSEAPEQKSDLRATLAGDGQRKRNVLIGVVAGAVVLIVIGAIVIANVLRSGEGDAVAGADGERLSVTIAIAEDQNYYDTIVEVAAEEGLDVEFQALNDWVLPNTELVAGSVDANAFQHNLFLSNFNVENGEDLTPVFSTQIVQWGIFSATHDSLDQIADGGAIAIPDDPSNGGRALLILQTAGLITLDPDAGLTPTIDDVVENPQDLTFSEIGATTIPQQFDDPSLEAAVVGTSYFDPSQEISNEDALYLDDELSESTLPYVNSLVTRQDNKDDPAWEILHRVYQDDRVRAAFDEDYFGNNALVDVPRAELEANLDELEELASQSS